MGFLNYLNFIIIIYWFDLLFDYLFVLKKYKKVERDYKKIK